MIKITVNGLAKYMASQSENQKREMLKAFKYPNAVQRAKAKYYQRAMTTIRQYHGGGYTVDWLRSKAASIRAEAGTEINSSRQLLLQKNAKAIDSYATHFGTRQFQSLPNVKAVSQIGEVEIRAWPELHVRERGKELFIKLEFAAQQPNERWEKVLGQALYELLARTEARRRPSNVRIFDVPRGRDLKLARVRSRVTRDIEEACRTITDTWARI